MSATRTIEVFSAGCPLCEELVERVRSEACPACEIRVHDLRVAEGAARARELGVGAVPAVAIDGALAACCEGGAPELATLREAGLGRGV